ncbi:MarR family winged helix-turn-helix transcriptional regulator [Conexibacter sp. DBS9H8]|uniref:MarR family winged helix-turn-helix transcriptional regulator n=1 Tax=Conexibacter sp. DBS9H8 TaxID=2937801 RepID=UPI00200F1AD1|nr:MarR family transcriptional regulator [Conexibacter sp. DBS9H8]
MSPPGQGETALLEEMLALVRGIDRVHSSGTLIDRSGIRLERGLHPVVMTIAKLEPVRTGELAQALALKSSTVSRHLARLEALDLVRRIADPDDKRASLLTLSPGGRRTHARLNNAWAEILSEQLNTAGSEDADAIATHLHQLVAALELIPLDAES